MNAQELFKQVNGEYVGTGRFYCEKCRIIGLNAELAEKCCRPTICQCGKEVAEKYYYTCWDCRKAKEIASEKLRFEKATKIKLEDYDGPVQTDLIGSNEGYFASFSDLMDYLSDEYGDEYRQAIVDEEAPVIDYVYAVNETNLINATLGQFLDETYEKAYEAFEESQLKGTEELEVALAKFNELNAHFKSWDVDQHRIIVLDKPCHEMLEDENTTQEG